MVHRCHFVDAWYDNSLALLLKSVWRIVILPNVFVVCGVSSDIFFEGLNPGHIEEVLKSDFLIRTLFLLDSFLQPG